MRLCGSIGPIILLGGRIGLTDFAGKNASPAGHLAGNKDGCSDPEFFASGLNDMIGDFDLAARRFQSPRVLTRVWGREGEKQEGDRLAFPIHILQGISRQNPAQDR